VVSRDWVETQVLLEVPKVVDDLDGRAAEVTSVAEMIVARVVFCSGLFPV